MKRALSVTLLSLCFLAPAYGAELEDFVGTWESVSHPGSLLEIRSHNNDVTVAWKKSKAKRRAQRVRSKNLIVAPVITGDDLYIMLPTSKRYRSQSARAAARRSGDRPILGTFRRLTLSRNKKTMTFQPYSLNTGSAGFSLPLDYDRAGVTFRKLEETTSKTGPGKKR